VPELPEVETTRRGIEPYVNGAKIREIIVKRHDLRQPVSPTVDSLEGKTIKAVSRRSKYLVFEISDGSTLMIHLGMSGSLRVIDPGADWKKHDHLGITLSNKRQLRFHDPRRFGLVLHFTEPPSTHPLLKNLGPEPLEESFTPAVLKAACAKRGAAIKLVIMHAKTVVGVGNIYASESLFRAGIRPQIPATKLTLPRIAKLTAAIKQVLTESIEQGGTTLRDFLHSEGEPGYFAQRLFVYDRKDEPCRACNTPIRHEVLGQRSTYWCPTCQK